MLRLQDYAIANKDSSIIGILGCGNQGRTHLEVLKGIFNIKKAVAFDINGQVLEKFAKEMGEKTEVNIQVATGVEEVVRLSDIVAVLISSPRPTVKYEWIKSGAVIIAASGFGQEFYKDEVYRNVDKIVMDEWGSYANDCLNNIGATEEGSPLRFTEKGAEEMIKIATEFLLQSRKIIEKHNQYSA